MKFGHTILLLLIALISCQPELFSTKWTTQKAPATFKARFETTHGTFDIQAVREWSPAGVDRLYQLLKYGYYKDMAIFRVVPGYVVQFGISNDTILNRAWNSYKVPDEPVLKENTFGTISFARGGPDSRGTQLFINIGNNSPRLDTINYKDVIGFPVVAEVTTGMDNVTQFFGEYANYPISRQDSILKYGNEWLQRNYPELDYIENAFLISDYQSY